ncbi:uncharacterized protein FFB20_09298 [Fusarium fujikuroi]|nr:uncharacterized protein Y057_11382 [Fusarium fujikuroi]KLP15688.1 uncharacterized protein LW94_13344 [Fusarium fujikuroi]SCN80950.1 uncharacterized protein FFC1_03736 [Fusarium fujikuroi]SCN92843.1 uncharacterized protein FFB20_09298 [Fusarium fujikuroi]SCO02944.1 uncharacterized protein FFE2_10111 [Fusarium fujikuroi]
MNSHSNYYSQGAAPGRSTPFPQRLRPADDPEIMQLKAELEAYRIIEEKAKTEEEQKKKEDKIRQDTEVAFQLRWEALQKAQEDTKREMERIKKEAEAAAWERVEKERREQESMRVREQHQARVMESEIRTKIEVERKAEEQERRSREKLESEIEMRLKKKMMDKVDELMRDFEQRLSIYPPVWPYQTGTQNQKELSCSQPETQLMNGYEPPQTWQPGLNGHHTRDAALCSPAPSQSPRTGYPPSNANLSHGVRLPSVPCASDPSQSPEEWSPQNSRFYRNSQADFFPHPSSPSRGRIRNQSQGYSTWQPYQEEYIGTRMHAHPELIQELAYAVNEVLRDQIFNGMTMRRDMDDRQHNHYSSSVHQVPVDPRAYSYAPDRAAAMEAQRQRQREREYQNGRSRQFGPPQGMMNGQGYGFERPAPSPSMMPQNRLSSTGGTFSVDRTSESSKAQSAYQTPPQSYRGAVLVTGNRPNASTTASTLCKAGEKNCESDQRGLPAPGDERLQTHVNQFLEVPSGNSKVEKQLSAANAYMDFKET